ncbi:YaaC family protein [Actinoplanes sp. NPDC026623]|uniref:YaaC family protein n=1 Tax=Actinoplanes sp. NPDC026623 TaxID=3155610 RepID=UPI0033C4089E
MATSSTWRVLRSLRHDPPGFANSKGARRTTFQAALEQSEQFVKAAGNADYATRAVHLFYALSQGGRAVIAASPRIAQDWAVTGHGLSADTNATTVADVTVYSAGDGIFQAVAKVLAFDPLVPDEKVSLGTLWPLIPETGSEPLSKQETLSALMFDPGPWPQHGPYWGASLAWIRPHVRTEFGEDKAGLAKFFSQYPALAGVAWDARQEFRFQDLMPAGLGIDLVWELGDGDRPAILQNGSGMVAHYGSRSRDWKFITPPVGSMARPLHPVLAWWCVLLGLSSLARYEPAKWSRMIDINTSPHATAIEHILDDAVERIPEMLQNILLNIDDPG